MTIEAIRKWGEGKPLSLVLFAAFFAQDAKENIDLVSSGNQWSRFKPSKSATQWVSLYKQHLAMAPSLGSVAFGFE